MQITVTIEDGDTDLLAGFCTATQWTESSGVSQEDWVSQKVQQFVEQQSVSGQMNAATADARAAYLSTINTSLTSIRLTTTGKITVGGGRVIGGGGGIKVP